MCGWQVKLCDPLVTHGPYLSALEVRHDEALYKSTFTLLTLLWHNVSALVFIIVVAVCQAELLLRWVAFHRFDSRLH